MDPDALMLLPLWYLVFLFALTCHEAAHAWAAYVGGDDTAYRGGQVSLNPLPHIQREPFGTIFVPLLSYVMMGWMLGWASAPYDPSWESRHPRRAAFMAAAGPAANLLLAAAAFGVLKYGLNAGWWSFPVSGLSIHQLVVPAGDAPAWFAPLSQLLSITLMLNLVLLVFNLIPLPPLDGASVLAGLFEPARQLRDSLSASPFGSMVGLLAAWVAFDYLFGPVLRWVLGLLFS